MAYKTYTLGMRMALGWWGEFFRPSGTLLEGR
jgi:hypothetical protein|eukprot:COSAG01_NODE_7741_length_3076_cov_11.159221_2_plen_32_part_00